MQNPQNSTLLYNSARKYPKQAQQSFKKLYASNSKRKDKIAFSAKQKRRESARVSIIGNFAKIKISPPFPPSSSPNQNINSLNKKTVDNTLLQQTKELQLQLYHQNKQIQQIINQIICRKKLLEQIKEVSEQTRSAFHKNSSIIGYLDDRYVQQQAEQFKMKNKINNLNYQIKKQFYQIGAHQNQLLSHHENLNYQIDTNQQQFTNKLQILQQITQKLLRSENKNRQYQEELKEVIQKNKAIKSKVELEQSHISILKLQINTNFYAGFNVSASGLDKKLLFDASYMSWDRNKQIKVTMKDLKRFILIQLYRGWRKILRKLSYQSTQYQVLFGELENQKLLESLRKFIYGEQNRISTKKANKLILIISPNNGELLKDQLRQELENFNNGLISITQVKFSKVQQADLLQLTYKTVAEQQKTQTYELKISHSITKEQLLKLTRSPDRKLFCFIEIPLLIPKNQAHKYEGVYEMMRKKSIKF